LKPRKAQESELPWLLFFSLAGGFGLALPGSAAGFSCVRSRYTPFIPLASETADFVRFGTQHPTKPMFLAEFATVEDDTNPLGKAQWISDAEALFKTPAYSQFVGVAYFNQTRLGTSCDWHIETSAAAQAACRAMLQKSFVVMNPIVIRDSAPSILLLYYSENAI